MYKFIADRSNDEPDFNKIRQHWSFGDLLDIDDVARCLGYSERKTKRMMNRFIRKNLVELAYEHN